MVYKNNFVLCVKHNGQILREEKEIVRIPFNEEYSLLFKNLDNRKALVSVYIDGKDVLNGRQLIIHANSTMELERFLNDDLNKGRRFRFIKMSDKIIEHRGNQIEDGIIRVEVQWEKRIKYNPIVTWTINGQPYLGDNSIKYGSSGDSLESYHSTSLSSFSSLSTSSCLRSCKSVTDVGITGKGSESQQSFAEGYIGAVESDKYVICLQLKGYKNDGSEVKKCLTVNEKVICELCGTKNSSKCKYCFECGNYLD